MRDMKMENQQSKNFGKVLDRAQTVKSTLYVINESSAVADQTETSLNVDEQTKVQSMYR